MSSVCRAAIHNGSIPATGGSFLIETLYGFNQAFKWGSFRNNIQTEGAGTEYRGFFTLRIKSSSNPETDVVSTQLTTTTVAGSSEITKTVDRDTTVSLDVHLAETKPSVSVPMQTTPPSIPESVSQTGSPTKSSAPLKASSPDTLQKESVKHTTLSVIYTNTSSSTSSKSQLNSQKAVTLKRNLTCGTTLQKLNQISFQSDKELFRATCPSGCARYSRSVYGAGPYEEMSSVCQAAIHNGSILASGGSFLIDTWCGFNKAFERMSFKNNIQTKKTRTKRAGTKYRGFITIKIEEFLLKIREPDVPLHSSLEQQTSPSDGVLEPHDIFLGNPAEIVLIVLIFVGGTLLASFVFFLHRRRVKKKKKRKRRDQNCDPTIDNEPCVCYRTLDSSAQGLLFDPETCERPCKNRKSLAEKASKNGSDVSEHGSLNRSFYGQKHCEIRYETECKDGCSGACDPSQFEF